jgi:hypothetical protein
VRTAGIWSSEGYRVTWVKARSTNRCASPKPKGANHFSLVSALAKGLAVAPAPCQERILGPDNAHTQLTRSNLEYLRAQFEG